MKKGISTSVMIALAGLLLVTAGALTAADVSEKLAIENSGYQKDKKGPVNLEHRKHSKDYKLACTECHHEYDEKGQNTWQEGQAVKKCKECHDPVAKKGKVMKLQNTFHKNCKTCHIEVTKGGKKAPHKICKECHQKKS